MARSRRHLSRINFVLAAMAPAEGGAFDPVHVQKLFFLIDRKAGHQLGRSYFVFEPYDYGPFDANIYSELAQLSNQGLVDISKESLWGTRQYRLTEEGQRLGKKALETLPVEAIALINKLCLFVRSLSFSELVSAIYRDYPEMKVNSVFSD